MNLYLADNQDITYAGLLYLCRELSGVETFRAENKARLMALLAEKGSGVVVIDYTLFDFNGNNDLYILADRYPDVHWLLFSEDLSTEFVRCLLATNSHFGVLLKESPLTEIRLALETTLHGRRFICQRMTETLLAPDAPPCDRVKLTPVETEILQDIARGLTTKEIADKRFSSFHTVNTHRKHIFRKLQVNSIHEATKYALRAGLVDTAEYYI